MSGTSTNLALPYLLPGQAQKHVTVNESLRRLDAAVQLSVVSATTTAQPGSPADGAVWILPGGKTGPQWAGFADGSLGYYRDGGWEELTPREGWLAYIRDTGQLMVRTGSSWSVSGLRGALGLGTMATEPAAGYAPLTGGTFTGAVVQQSGGVQWISYETDGPADAKRWNMYFEGGSFALIVSDDAGTIYNNFWQATRSGATPTGFFFGSTVGPLADTAYSLGQASQRWSTVYAATGAINTSDAREKTPLRPLADAERRAVRRVIAGVGLFQWLSSVAAKGEDAARLHAGVTAQAVAGAFTAEGLDAARYGLFCADAIKKADGTPGGDDPADVRLGLRIDQLLMMAIAVLADGESGGDRQIREVWM